MAILTRQQKKVFDFVVEFIKRRGYSPSMEEVARGVGLNSKATVHAHLRNLREKGFLKMSPGRARSIEPVISMAEVAALKETPLLGFVSAGKPIEAIENPETIFLPPELTGRGETFVLRVRGNSMINDHILDGDYVIVERRETADNGNTVVALIDGLEATIKRFHHDKNGVRLEPRNPKMAPLTFSPERVAIRGIVVGVLRRMKS
jgi:repressor LexA